MKGVQTKGLSAAPKMGKLSLKKEGSNIVKGAKNTKFTTVKKPLNGKTGTVVGGK